MSWPSFYGYKYTPIGLRQRERKDDSGTRSICTTVHLPQGGHLLDIERQYGIDGSMAKRETQNMSPASAVPVTRPSTRAASPSPVGLPSDFFEPRKEPSDFERQADDIIANFRARQGTGLEDSREAIQHLEDTFGKYSKPLRREVSPSAASKVATAGDTFSSFASSKAALSSSEMTSLAKEDSTMTASTRVRRMLKKAAEDF
ncbi:uncharacterized protein LOC119599326 isoform X1 [Penaeus monodon]|uniref:uncharacterized protein LOC119599326 isoform X1 n=1 Tax=Penaeus monodon TaxID=6687 RepID=UPI0018A76BD3|nr:uncharacterized protein LOC119599326 isoform X1 [Penaeus monodon]